MATSTKGLGVKVPLTPAEQAALKLKQGATKVGMPTAPVGVSPLAATNRQDRVDAEVATIVAKGSPLMDQAASRGLAVANRRGLMNSSIGVGASQAAVLDVALPMASQNAAQAYGKNLSAQNYNQGAQLQNQAYREQSALSNQDANQRGNLADKAALQESILSGQGYGQQRGLAEQGYGFQKGLASQAGQIASAASKQAYGQNKGLAEQGYGFQKGLNAQEIAAREALSAQEYGQNKGMASQAYGFQKGLADQGYGFQKNLNAQQNQQQKDMSKLEFGQSSSLQKSGYKFDMEKMKLGTQLEKQLASQGFNFQKEMTKLEAGFQADQTKLVAKLDAAAQKKQMTGQSRQLADANVNQIFQNYQTQISTIMSNPNLPANERNKQLANAQKLVKDRMAMTEDLYTGAFDWPKTVFGTTGKKK